MHERLLTSYIPADGNPTYGDGTATSDRYMYLLGLSMTALVSLMGEPTARHYYKDNEIWLYYQPGDRSPVSCTFDNEGRIIRVEDIEERRGHPRIRPVRTKHIYIRTGKQAIDGHVIDMSESGLSIKIITAGPWPSAGTAVKFCTSLRTRRHVREWVTLYGVIHRIDADDNRMIIIVTMPVATHSYNVYRNYINATLAREHISKLTHATFPNASPEAPEATIIKTDACATCIDKLCGHSLWPSTSSDLS